MNSLLNLSEPEFLLVYLAGLSIAVQWARVARRRLRRVRDIPPRRPLSLDELAYLAGGPRRVTETAATRLVESGALRLGEDETVRATGGRSHDPIDEAVLAEAKHGDIAIALVATRAARQDVVTAVGHRLTALGLIVDPRLARARLRPTVLPLLVVAAFGLVRLVNDSLHGRPVGSLAALLMITVAVAILLASPSTPHRTVHGRWVLHEANMKFYAVVTAECPLAGAARLVALGGLIAGRNLTRPGQPSGEGGQPNGGPDRVTRLAER